MWDGTEDTNRFITGAWDAFVASLRDEQAEIAALLDAEAATEQDPEGVDYASFVEE